MLAVSIDPPEQAARLAKDLALPFAILSDPRMDVIRADETKGDGMDMVDMGYVLIDKQGLIRTRRIDRASVRTRALLHARCATQRPHLEWNGMADAARYIVRRGGA